jgi:hypothetical protein
VKENIFLSKEVKPKRVGKGILVALSVVIMIFVIGSYFTNSVDNYLRDKYKTEKIVYLENDNVLGEENNIDLSKSEDFQTDYTKWLYNEADKIVDTYDISDKEIINLIQIPGYKFESNNDVYEQKYILSTDDTLTIICTKLESEFETVYDIHHCDISLNSNKEFTAWSWTDNITISPHITIFDDKNLDYPLVVVGEGFGYGSRDNLSVYKIIDGKFVNIKFKENEKIEDTWWADPYTKMYIEDNKEYLLTYFHDPIMIEKSLTSVWEISDTELNLVETILERGLEY